MAKRHPVTILLLPASRAKHAVHYADGYAPAADARFAVVRDEGLPDGVWVLVHQRTGARVDSLLPPVSRRLTMTDKLQVAAAFHAATHLDWAEFDALPATSEGQVGGMPEWGNKDAAQRTAAELRTLAAQAVG